MLAWQMNGDDLPFLNGYPLRLVVPGYYGTYWIKHLSNIQVLLSAVSTGFWMASAYRIPTTPARASIPAQHPRPPCRFAASTSAPSSPACATDRRCRQGARRRSAGSPSTAAAASRRSPSPPTAARPGSRRSWAVNHGRYSFHEWTAPFRPDRKGPHDLQVRAVNRDGETQPAAARWNPPATCAYVIETIWVNVA